MHICMNIYEYVVECFFCGLLIAQLGSRRRYVPLMKLAVAKLIGHTTTVFCVCARVERVTDIVGFCICVLTDVCPS